MKTAQIHLIIDFYAVDSNKGITRVMPTAVSVLGWTWANGPWASVTVASGAFPNTISNLPTGTHTRLHRYDAAFWMALTSTSGLRFKPDYGDYGINYPLIGAAVPRGPLPNLRHTVGDHWNVWREPMTPPGNQGFRVLCGKVVAAPGWHGSGYCWGDGEVARCSTGAGGAGTASEWRAYSTSRHLQVVTDRLTTVGAP